MSIAVVNSHQNAILYIEKTSRNRYITCLIHIACTISGAIAKDCLRPRQENFLHDDAFLFNEFNFFQAREIDLLNHIRTAIEIIGIGILIKKFEEIKDGIKIKLLIGIK